jgi:predicted nucleic acid-binding protein
LSYFLDTNACIALINGKPAFVRIRFQKAVDAGAEVSVSTVVAFELWYGVGKSQQREANTGDVRASAFYRIQQDEGSQRTKGFNQQCLRALQFNRFQ